jgi:hypothetical protein
MMLGYQIPLKVALCAPETRSGVILIQMVADDLSLQALKLPAWFKSQWKRDQLSSALKNEEHRGRTLAISSIAS